MLVPYVQLGRMLPDIDDTTRDETPAAFSGLAEQGRQIYAADGCVYCHSQQIGSRADSADLDREGWGARRTVARDYLRDRAVYLGNSRLGPDLANIGVRHDKAGWYYQRFYDPANPDTGGSPGTNCPPLRFMFDFHVIKGQPSTDAIKLTKDEPAVPVVEAVPRHDAKALAAYLLSLKRSSYKLPEAPRRPLRTPKTDGETDSTCRRFRESSQPGNEPVAETFRSYQHGFRA